MGSKTYIEKILAKYEKMYGEKPRKGVRAPMQPGEHPELDAGPHCTEEQAKEYQSSLGMLQWAVTLGRFDIHCAVMTMGAFCADPKVSHVERLKRIFPTYIITRSHLSGLIQRCQIIPTLKWSTMIGLKIMGRFLKKSLKTNLKHLEKPCYIPVGLMQI
jgi:hypothetical protein